MTFIVLAALLGLVPATIAQRKGYSFGSWWLCGALLFIVALPYALFIERNPARFQQCPWCREWASRAASVCPHCARELPPPALRTEVVGMPRPVRGAIPTWVIAVVSCCAVVVIGAGAIAMIWYS